LGVASGVVGKNIGEAESCNFPTDISKFPRVESIIIGDQNINFALNFPQNKRFLAQILYFWTEI